MTHLSYPLDFNFVKGGCVFIGVEVCNEVRKRQIANA